VGDIQVIVGASTIISDLAGDAGPLVQWVILWSFSMLSLITVLTLFSSSARAEDPSGGNFGLGIGGGMISTGISGKYYQGPVAFQGVVGWWGLGREGTDALGLNLDFLKEQPSFAGGGPLQLGWNYGLGGGAVIVDGGGLGLGASGIAGLEFLIQPVPLDIVLEYRPGLWIVPDVNLDLVNFSGHIRYYF
jgi:hypothetical protein